MGQVDRARWFSRAARPGCTWRRHLGIMAAGSAVLLATPVTTQPLGLTTLPRPTAASSVVVQATAVSARPSKVLVVVLENHGSGSALRQMPYLATQARSYARASSYYAVRHPSLPNYLVMAGGSTFGVTDSRLPASHRLTGSSVFGQVIDRGRTARTYAEGMSTNCQRTNTGRYVARHNPWTYFASAKERSRCLKYDVPAGSRTAGALHRDVAAGRLPTYSMLIPDQCHNAHDCRLSTADSWLKPWLLQIKAGPDFRSGRLAVVVTFDEDEGTSGNRVLTVVMHPARRGVLVTRRLNHYSLAAMPSRQVGAVPLRGAAGTPNFLAAFGLR